jgi:hypothetical protein
MILDTRDYRVVHILGHVEIHDSLGQFIVSGDTVDEAIDELATIRAGWARNNLSIA